MDASENPTERQTETTGHRGMHATNAVRDGLIGGIHSAREVAGEGVHVIRDVATDTVRAAGEIGTLAVGTACGLLREMADGMRDVIGHITTRNGRDAEHKEH
jgi:hypothetical protein